MRRAVSSIIQTVQKESVYVSEYFLGPRPKKARLILENCTNAQIIFNNTTLCHGNCDTVGKTVVMANKVWLSDTLHTGLPHHLLD